MKEFEFVIEYYDYFFSKSHATRYDTVKACSLSEATKLVHWKYGSLVEILSIEEIVDI